MFQHLVAHLDRSHMSRVRHNASNPNHVREARRDGEKDDSVRVHVLNSSSQYLVAHSKILIKEEPKLLIWKTGHAIPRNVALFAGKSKWVRCLPDPGRTVSIAARASSRKQSGSQLAQSSSVAFIASTT